MGRSGGTYVCDDLRKAGLDVGKASGEVRAFPEDLRIFDDPAHSLFEPRSKWDLDKGFLSSLRIAADDDSWIFPIVTARRNGPQGIEVCDGTRTTLHLRAVNVERVAAGKRPVRVLVRFMEGNDRAFLLLRLRLNAQRADDTPSTLAHKFRQAEREGATFDEIAATRPGCTPRMVADVLRWPSLMRAVQEALETRLPLECISAFVDVPREDQGAVLAGVLAQLPDGPVSPRKVKAAVREATGGKPAGERKPRPLSRAKLDRVIQAVTPGAKIDGPAAGLWSYFLAGVRLAAGHDGINKAVDVALMEAIRAALAAKPPKGRKGK